MVVNTADRGIVEYSICDNNGNACHDAQTVDAYGPTLDDQTLWTSPTLTFGAYTVKARPYGKGASSSGSIVDLDYLVVN